ncbi:MAG TPA: GAF domain-containing protein [Chloroflexota bacterium]|nr:GAF domain-containing protein [Chloroflexota bacterium]
MAFYSGYNEAVTDYPVSLRAEESALLLEIANATSSTLDLHEVLDRIAEKTARLTGADRCSLWLLDTTHDLLVPGAIYGVDPNFARQWKRRFLTLREERLSQEAIGTGQPVVVLDAASDPRTDKRAVDFFGDKSFLVVPLPHKGRVIGTLFLNHISHHHHYSSREITVVQAIASQSAVAIINAQLYEESRRQRQELLASFRRIGEALAAGLDLHETLRLVADLAREMLQATVGALTLSASNGGVGEVQWAPLEAAHNYRQAVGTLPDLAAEVVRRGEPLYIGELANEDGTHFGVKPLRTYVGVPLRLRGEIIGTLGMYHSLPRQFSPSEIELLASFGNQAAVAIDNARLFTRLQRKVEELSAAAARNAELYTNLQVEKQRLDVIFRNSSDAILMVDREGQIVAFNPAAEVLTGWPVSQSIGRRFDAVFCGVSSGIASLAEATARVLAEGTVKPTLVEATIITRNGGYRDVAASYAYVPARNGEGPYALAVVRDISHQKEVERLKSDFISMVSHELRTPLAVIKGYAATLLNAQLHLGPERQLKFIRGINDASDRLTRLIDNLLSVSRLESGRFKLNPQPIDVVDLVHKVISGMHSSTTKHNLRYELPDERVTLVVDHDQIEQVLLNLVTNAVKYSPEGGDLVVTVREVDGSLSDISSRAPLDSPRPWVVLAVRDCGIGISTSQLPQIFDKFYRGDSPAVRRVAGTGLGLYICKSIVEAHQGHIWAESEIGCGSTFFVALPRE